MTLVTLTCYKCGEQFQRSLKRYTQDAKKYKRFHCGCRVVPETIPCENCGTQTSNPRFCSKRCRATFFHKNDLMPKRQPQGACEGCGFPVSTSRKWCEDCRPAKEQSKKDWSSVTLGQAREQRRKNNDASVWDLSKREYKRSGKPRRCFLCGYDKIFHVAHIKPVASFPDETPLTEVNHINNLVALCPNHHWEFDHGMLDVVDAKSTELLTSPL